MISWGCVCRNHTSHKMMIACLCVCRTNKLMIAWWCACQTHKMMIACLCVYRTHRVMLSLSWDPRLPQLPEWFALLKGVRTSPVQPCNRARCLSNSHESQDDDSMPMLSVELTRCLKMMISWWCVCRTHTSRKMMIACRCLCPTHKVMISWWCVCRTHTSHKMMITCLCVWHFLSNSHDDAHVSHSDDVLCVWRVKERACQPCNIAMCCHSNSHESQDDDSMPMSLSNSQDVWRWWCVCPTHTSHKMMIAR